MSVSHGILRYGLFAHAIVFGWAGYALSQQPQPQQPARVAMMVPGPASAAITSGLVSAPVAAPVAAPVSTPTIWNRLGIPQGFNRARDATANARGNRPGMERTDPLLRIADPANLNSPNPAIKKAAEVKADQDLAPQKIKAIKYLATIGCGCYPGVAKALADELSDCTEEVRYEAAKALCQTAGNPCQRCNNEGCCSAEVMNKLQDVATGQDAQGCFKEASARVRQMAQQALDACKRKHPVTPGPQPPVIPIPPVTPANGGVEKHTQGKPPVDSSTVPSVPILAPPVTAPTPAPPAAAPTPAPSDEKKNDMLAPPDELPASPPTTHKLSASESVLTPLTTPGTTELRLISVSGESHAPGVRISSDARTTSSDSETGKVSGTTIRLRLVPTRAVRPRELAAGSAETR
jgi:hypothetical protein